MRAAAPPDAPSAQVTQAAHAAAQRRGARARERAVARRVATPARSSRSAPPRAAAHLPRSRPHAAATCRPTNRHPCHHPRLQLPPAASAHPSSTPANTRVPPPPAPPSLPSLILPSACHFQVRPRPADPGGRRGRRRRAALHVPHRHLLRVRCARIRGAHSFNLLHALACCRLLIQHPQFCAPYVLAAHVPLLCNASHLTPSAAAARSCLASWCSRARACSAPSTSRRASRCVSDATLRPARARVHRLLAHAAADLPVPLSRCPPCETSLCARCSRSRHAASPPPQCAPRTLARTCSSRRTPRTSLCRRPTFTTSRRTSRPRRAKLMALDIAVCRPRLRRASVALRPVPAAARGPAASECVCLTSHPCLALLRPPHLHQHATCPVLVLI